MKPASQKALEELIYNTVADYIDDADLDTDTGLAVNPDTLEVSIIPEADAPDDADWYPLSDLVRFDTEGELLVDEDATAALAAEYLP